MKRHRYYGFVLFWCVLALGIVRPAHAQTLFGSLVGNVKDTSGAVISGATVTLTNKETTQSRQATTGDAGNYNFPTIPAGIYEVKATVAGFSPQVQEGIVVAANDTMRVDITLQPGAVTETVTVSSAVALLQT